MIERKKGKERREVKVSFFVCVLVLSKNAKFFILLVSFSFKLVAKKKNFSRDSRKDPKMRNLSVVCENSLT